MPQYEYVCINNKHKFDRFLKLADYRLPQTCECGSDSRRVISLPMLNCDMQPWDRYISPASGKVITSYKERKKDMAETGCVDYEPSLKKHITKHWESEEAKLEKAMDETVESEVEKMPIRKREKLAEELTSGADCQYTRI